MLRLLDRLNDLLAWIAAWLFFATAAMITWEVVARYVFTAPTVWAEELSRVFLVWGTFLAMAALLRRRSHIRITIVTGLLAPGARRAAEIFSLAVIAVVAGVAAWYGWTIALDSIERGRTTATMLDLPQWLVEVSVPLGFLLLGLQALAETWRLLAGAPLPADPAETH
jgi:TRAP-type C4-dicarboxylate transport system permease small subunit